MVTGKKVALIIASILLVSLLSGCETCKGTAKGFGEGISTDVDNIWQGLSRADDWVRYNLW